MLLIFKRICQKDNGTKYHSLLKGIRVPYKKKKKKLISELGQEKYKSVLNILVCQKVKKCPQKDGRVSKGHRKQVEGGCIGQIWVNVKTIMPEMDYSTLNIRSKGLHS